MPRTQFFASRFAQLCLVAVMVSVGPQMAFAAEPATLATEAEALARQGDMTAALDKMQQASDALWDLQPFTLQSAGYVNGTQTITLLAGETLSVRSVLSGFGYGGSSNALTVDLAVDLEIRHESGRVLATQQDFAVITQAVPRRLADFAVELSVTTPPLRNGTYEAVFTLRDINGGGAQTFSLPFVIDGIAN